PTPPAWLVDTLYTHPEREREGIYYREGWRFVRANPGRALGLYFTKIGSLWSFVPRTATKTAYSNRISDVAMGLCSLTLFLGGLVGLFRLGPYNVPFLPLTILSFTVMSAVFLTVMRYRMSIEVLVLWMAGVGIAWLIDRTPTPREA